MNVHQTPLSTHLKEKHLWFDLSLLVVLWILVFIIPDQLWHIGGVTLNFIIKILALVASLEFISFLSFHLMSHKNSLLLQGFLGGFISSTTVFMQLNYDLKFKNIDEKIITQALLLAICSMLIECVLIVITVTKNFNFISIVPLLSMLIFISMAIMYIRQSTKSHPEVSNEIINIEIDHPITWKKVARFSLYIALLKFILLIIQNNTNVPVLIGVFLASLFEAHAIIAIKMSEMNSTHTIFDFYSVIAVILTGSTFSKMFFVFRGKVLQNKMWVVLPNLLALSLTIILIFLLREMSYVS